METLKGVCCSGEAHKRLIQTYEVEKGGDCGGEHGVVGLNEGAVHFDNWRERARAEVPDSDVRVVRRRVRQSSIRAEESDWCLTGGW